MDKELFQYGIAGIGLFAMGYFIVKLINDARLERKEMLDKFTDVLDENNKVIREHTNMLSGIKSLLENKK